METFLDMQTELTERLMVASSSTLFPLTRIKKLLQNSYTWAKQLYDWNELERGRDSNAVIGQDYYDYPDDFQTDTLGEYLYFNGQKYDQKSFKDFIRYREDYPNSTKRIYADYGRQYFIFPTPTVIAVITVWGQVLGAQIVNDADTTIFSSHDSSGNEAIVERAFGVAMKRIDANASKDAIGEAVSLLTIIFKKQQKRQQTAQTLNKPMFEVPNFFPERGNGFVAGNFGQNIGGSE